MQIQTLVLNVSLTVPMKVEIREEYDAAIEGTSVGDKITLTFDENDPNMRVAAISSAGLIGWLPSNDSVVGKLLDGFAYRATVKKIVRGRYGRRFASVVIEVTVPSGKLTVGEE